MTRPRLSKDFVDRHRRDRLVTGLAHCIVEKGYRQTTVADVVSATHVARNTFYNCVATAAVSRRTFYEHFDGKRSAIAAMLTRAQRDDARTFLFDSALGHLWAEVIAAAFCGDEVGSESRRRQAQAVVGILGAQLDAAVAA